MKVLFTGPTLASQLPTIEQRGSAIDIRGPAAWGDVAQAVHDGATRIGIVDGYFEQTRSVWHKEIIFALSHGVKIAGAASLGALRAAECAPFGMIAIGTIANDYISGALVDDSDVALVHAPAEVNYLALSEPRVNVIATLNAMAKENLLSTTEWKNAKAVADRMFYAELSLRAVFSNMQIMNANRIERLIELAKVKYVDQKQVDALELVDWLQSDIDVPAATGKPWAFNQTTQWLEMREAMDSHDG
ncbi:TfuA-like protein [Anderseniella sp. Alg231-50]|uniref:TfuA-like protein n=1 Tax=Anderseniella sp. Alg231-50 TaxID=1922226 RepID=UPI000D5613F0